MKVAQKRVGFGNISTGGQNDLQRASDMVRSMVMECGMSEWFVLLAHAQPPQPRYKVNQVNGPDSITFHAGEAPFCMKEREHGARL
jgi:ATP-dependent Zn protease